MKHIFILFLLFFIFPAFAVTSESYVNSAVTPLQNEISAVNTNTVLTNTGTTGEIGTKKIYDETKSFAPQTDALVTAETFNAAVQNAIDNEFVCIEWDNNVHDNAHCLLYQIQPVTQKQTLPSAYTQVEYLFGNFGPYINTQIPWSSVARFRGKAQQQTPDARNRAVLGSSTCSAVGCFFGTRYKNGYSEWYYASSVPTTTIAEFDIQHISDSTWTGMLNGVEITTSDATYYDRVLIMASGDTTSRTFNGYVWYIQLFGPGGNLLFNGIPARRKSDDVLGMYDTVTGVFFTNAGTGEFVAGPDVNSNLYLPTGT